MDILMHEERWNGKLFWTANSNSSDCPKYATERKKERDRKSNRERGRNERVWGKFILILWRLGGGEKDDQGHIRFKGCEPNKGYFLPFNYN